MFSHRNHATKAYVGIGSNLGDRAGNLLLAVRGMTHAAMTVTCLSSIYETAPVSEVEQPPFLNMVAEIGSHLPTPEQMMARLLVWIARGWQLGPSRILPPSCRYQPSCSAYAITAIQRYGAARGGWMALKRICRCHPWGGQGPDPVP